MSNRVAYAGNPTLDQTKTGIPGNNLPNSTAANLGNSSYESIAQGLNSVADLVNEKKAKASVIKRAWPGYLPRDYQKDILATTSTSVYCQQGWLTQKKMLFTIHPGDSQRYNPSQIELVFKVQFRKADGAALADNMCPVEHIESQLFSLIRVMNTTTGNYFTQAIEPRVEVKTMYQHWYWDKKDYKLPGMSKNNFLVEKLGRRLKAGESNLRLAERMKNDRKHFAELVTMKINCSFIHKFFRIDELIADPVTIEFYLETNNKKLFEVVPGAAVKNVYEEPAKVVYDDSFVPQLTFNYYTMSESYKVQEGNLWKENGLYILAESENTYQVTKAVPTGATFVTIDIPSVKEQPNFLIFTIQSQTTADHGSVYDNTGEEMALAMIKLLTISNLNTKQGLQSMQLTVNDENFQNSKRYLYESFRRLVTGAPIGNTSSSLRGTYYHKNFLTDQDEYFDKAVDTSKGTWPIVVDVSPSRGYFGTLDEPALTSPHMQVNIIFKKATTENLNCVVTVITSTNIIREMTPDGKTQIIKL